ncbi:thiamine phosphate synthase [Virgibacillus sp. W0181]|uniref:thiamine phosphate synthase n=1 Tax=Virgibacillus sp. W0181 TaxID=3391581 RepID=UPI003F45AC0E
MNTLKRQLRKYFIMGSQNCITDPETVLNEAIQGGITAFQFREKGAEALHGNECLELGRKLRDQCRNHDVLFIVNDDPDLANLLQADGIHVGQDDSHVAKIRKRFPDKIIGLSVANVSEVHKSPIHLVDYIGAGPVFATKTKTDAKDAVGTKWIQTLRTMFPLLPIVGIGGITAENAASVITAGADGVCTISAITKAQDIQAVVDEL